MSPQQRVAYFAVLLTLLAPTLPLGFGWRRLLKGNTEPAGQQPGGFALLLLLLISASFLYLLMGLFAMDLIGEDYSPRLYAAININLGVMLTATFAAAFIKDRTRIPVLIGALLVALGWFYVLVVNSVV